MTIKHTFFLDQGETLGGAERFLLDFFGILNEAEHRRLRPQVVGAQLPEYRERLPKDIPVIDFDFPSVRGGIVRKCLACFQIFFAARRLKQLAETHHAIRFFSNTPRTHFVMLLAKKIFRLKGLWIAYFHDFTTRPNFLLRSIGKNADFLLVNSLPTRRYLRERISEGLFEKIKIVENGLDLSILPEAEPSRKIEKILSLGRIDPRKGQKFTIKIANILQKEKILNFFIVGDSFPLDARTVDYEKEIKELVQKEHLENVHFVPAVKQPFDVIMESDLLLVLPTEPETFGRVVIEALACGKLVLAFDETGPREILKAFEVFIQQKNKQPLPQTLRVPKKDIKTLTQKIQYFRNNPDILQKYTAYARAFVEQKFSLHDTKKRLLNVLLEHY